MAKYKVDIGDRFGRWVVIENLGSILDNNSFKVTVKVQCDCGIVKQHFLSTLRYGLSKSCGCFRKENAGELIKSRDHKHNLSKHPLYILWRGMKCRCHNINDKGYPNYGARGIFVCDEWKGDFKKYYDWAIKNGWQKGLIIDRMDNNKGYHPDNCRFVSPSISMRNTRRNVMIEHNGKSQCITDWATDLSITTQALKKRLKKWDDNTALSKTRKTT